MSLKSTSLPWLAFFLLITPLLQSGCLSSRGQRYHDFTVEAPVPREQILVLGFMGGRVAWNNPREGVRRLAIRLRSRHLPISVETIENNKRQLALELVHHAFDRNGDDRLDSEEKSSVRLLLFGQSFGGAAVVKFARQLQKQDIPVLLTVQIDSVGRRDGLIPGNVRKAANLFQRNGWFVRGQPKIRAEDPTQTRIVANLEFDYRNKKIDLSKVSFAKKIFRKAHTKMNCDPEVWAKVEELILETIEENSAGR